MASQTITLPSDADPATQGANSVVLPSDRAPATTTSQSLGFYEGLMHPLDRAAAALSWLSSTDRPAGIVPDIGPEAVAHALWQKAGLPTAAQLRQGHEQYIADQEKKGIVPGGIGEFAGNVVGTLPTAALGPIAGGAVAGGLLGNSDTAGGTVADMMLGAVGGKAGDLAAKGLSAVAKPLVTSVANKAQDWTNPLASATRDAGQYVYGLLGDKAPMDVRMAGALAAGKPITAAEAIGRTGTTALAAVGRRTGTTADLLSGAMQERAAQAPDRILSDYALASGIDPAAARGDMDALLSVGRADAKPLYDAVLSRPDAVWNATLASLANRPVIRKAISQAADDLRNAGKDLAAYGFSPPDPVTGVSWLLPDKHPTAEAWDLVKKNVSGQIERDPFGKPIPDSISRGNYNIGVAGRDLTTEMRNAIPGYGAALDRSGDYLSLNRAFEDGQNFILNSNVTSDQLADRVAGLSTAELQAFKGGIANKLFDKAQLKSFGASIFDAPLVRQKLMAVLGPQDAKQFLDRMKIEADMKKVGQRISPDAGSITSNILNATGEQDASQKGAALMDALYAGMHLKTGNPVGFGMRMLSAARRLGWGVEGKMPEATRNEVGRLLMMSPADLANHLEILDRTFNPPAAARIAGAVNAARPAISAAGAAAGPALVAPPAVSQEATQ